MRRSFSAVKKESDNYISMTFLLMCDAMNKQNSTSVNQWYRDILTQTSFATEIGLLTIETVSKIDSACEAVYKKYYSEL